MDEKKVVEDAEDNNQTVTQEELSVNCENEEFLSFDQDKIEMESLRTQVKDLKETVLRGLAENENLRKRHTRELADAQKYAISNLVKDMTNVLENLYRATEHVDEGMLNNDLLKKLVEGVDITRREFIATLERFGVKRILPQIGNKFDHNYHQALSQQPSDEYPSDTIVAVVQAGYALEDRLLRPALVVVSKQC